MAKAPANPPRNGLVPYEMRKGDTRKNRTVSLCGDLWERVGVAAGRHVGLEGRTMSRGELIEALIAPFLKRYVIQDRAGGSAAVDDSPGSPVETLPMGEALTPPDGEDGGPSLGRGGETGEAPRRRRA